MQAELKQSQGHATIQLQTTVVHNVAAVQRQVRHVQKVLVQLMVGTPLGHHGAHALNHAEVEVKEEPEVVQILLHNMVVHSVQELLHKHKAVTLTTVQFTVDTLHGQAGVLVQ